MATGGMEAGAIVGPSTSDYRQTIENLAADSWVLEGSAFSWISRRALGSNGSCRTPDGSLSLPSMKISASQCSRLIANQCPVVVSDQVYSAEYLEPEWEDPSPASEERWVEFFRRALVTKYFEDR